MVGATRVNQASAISAVTSVRPQAVSAVRAQSSDRASHGMLRASAASAMIRTSVIVDRWCVTTVPAAKKTVRAAHALRPRPRGDRITRT